MRALVAMSGGVDSSVAAALMLADGWEVVGVTLKQWEGSDGSMPTAGCCTVGDAEDARRVAAQLDIPYYVLDHTEDFRAAVVEPFGRAYGQGRTPNPCIDCNRKVRFATLLERTEALGCDVLVTGHHARVTRDDDGYHLRAAVDATKDQSYVLHMLDQERLARVRLPIGELTKDEVRRIAAERGLRTAGKPDSQDLCFVGDGDYRGFLRREFPEVVAPGEIVDTSGTVLGHHDGTAGFTIGQRRGLGIAVGAPRYVVAVEPDDRRVVVGTREELLVEGCDVEGMTFVAGAPPEDASVEVMVRYRGPRIPARLEPNDRGAWTVRFRDPAPAPAPGQAAVLYRGDEVLGGGTIVELLRP